jgi:alanine racemase
LYIHGKPAPIIGNICMDLTMVDVSPTPDPTPGGEESALLRPFPEEGDEVIIFGDQHPVAELAREMGTIPYEVLTGISRRVKRIYYYE